MGKVKGYWEEYRCGCVSLTAPRRRDLLGYCPIHGDERRAVYRDYPDYDPTPTKEV